MLIIDNYDSFTYNIYHYCREILFFKPQVIKNDYTDLEGLFSQNPKAIIISPGPSSPKNSGICFEVIKKALDLQIPLLGICLGMQCLVHYFGGEIIKCSTILHGKISKIIHNGKGIFKGIKNNYNVTRYHSLCLKEAKYPFYTTATSDDNTIMAVEHKNLPLFGIQFHPEAHLTQFGHKLMKNFFKIAKIL